MCSPTGALVCSCAGAMNVARLSSRKRARSELRPSALSHRDHKRERAGGLAGTDHHDGMSVVGATIASASRARGIPDGAPLLTAMASWGTSRSAYLRFPLPKTHSYRVIVIMLGAFNNLLQPLTPSLLVLQMHTNCCLALGSPFCPGLQTCLTS